MTLFFEKKTPEFQSLRYIATPEKEEKTKECIHDLNPIQTSTK